MTHLITNNFIILIFTTIGFVACKSENKTGEIAICIGGMNLCYTLILENGRYRVDKIDNLGILNR